MIDHKKESVLRLAEEIFIHKVANKDGATTLLETYAGQAFEAAMIFRETEEEIFNKE